MTHECTEERFIADVEEHQMKILKDDGIYRHLVFKRPDSMNMMFGIVTWSGYLCYYGDMGSYVFCRVQDMFCFFRGDKKEHMRINPSYWAQKVEAPDKGSIHMGTGSDGISEFSESKFKNAVREWVSDESPGIKCIVEKDICSGSYERPSEAYDAIYEYRLNGKDIFQDFWEVSVNEYCYRFIWCCYALVWAIHQYDNFKQGEVND